MRKLLVLILMFFPWCIRRRLMVALLGYKIDPTARIGFSWIYPEHLEMGLGTRIGNLTLCKGLSLLKMDEQSSLGNLDWITGFPAASKEFFQNDLDRQPELVLGAHAAITNRHLIDCTNSVCIGTFSTFGGFRSQILTHSINLAENRQKSLPITIGRYCFVGTSCILLGGSSLPDRSILGANSLLNKAYSEPNFLYAGSPARPVKALSPDLAYFQRSTGFVN